MASRFTLVLQSNENVALFIVHLKKKISSCYAIMIVRLGLLKCLKTFLRRRAFLSLRLVCNDDHCEQMSPAFYCHFFHYFFIFSPPWLCFFFSWRNDGHGKNGSSIIIEITFFVCVLGGFRIERVKYHWHTVPRAPKPWRSFLLACKLVFPCFILFLNNHQLEHGVRF